MIIEIGPEKEGDDGISRLFGIGSFINASVLTSWFDWVGRGRSSAAAAAAALECC